MSNATAPETGTKANPLDCYSIHEACDAAVERGRPVFFRCLLERIKLGKAFPSRSYQAIEEGNDDPELGLTTEAKAVSDLAMAGDGEAFAAWVASHNSATVATAILEAITSHYAIADRRDWGAMLAHYYGD